MKSNRYIPFGYKLENGVMTIHAGEAHAVRGIYRLYQDGGSIKTIAAQMEASGIAYHNGNPTWNKNMIKRILENRKYVGEKEYPSIIQESEFQAANRIKDDKTKAFAAPYRPALRERAVCGECGSQVYRYTSDKSRWRCQSRQCTFDITITDKRIEDAVTALLNSLIANPDLIQSETTADVGFPLEITKLTNEINRELDKTDFNEQHVTALIFACTAEKYDHCDDGDTAFQTEKIKDTLASQNHISILDDELVLKTVRHFFIAKNGLVSIELLSGQIINESSEPCQCAAGAIDS